MRRRDMEKERPGYLKLLEDAISLMSGSGELSPNRILEAYRLHLFHIDPEELPADVKWTFRLVLDVLGSTADSGKALDSRVAVDIAEAILGVEKMVRRDHSLL